MITNENDIRNLEEKNRNQMKKCMKRMMGLLFSFFLMLGLIAWMNLNVYAATDIYTNLIPTSDETDPQQVTFNGYKWYIIEDNSTSATSGTVTLFAADTSFGTSVFSDSGSSDYSSSTVKAMLDELTTSGAFKDVADAIVNTDYGKLYLLSSNDIYYKIPTTVRKTFFATADRGAWWLRSPENDIAAECVNGDDGNIHFAGAGVTKELGVRPALQLDLSAVIFSSESNTFSKKIFIHNFTYSTDGSTITATCDNEECNLADNKVVLTIAAPALTPYSGTHDAEADLIGLNAFNAATGLDVKESSIAYYNAKIQEGIYIKDGEEPLGGVPIIKGDYLAEISVNDCIASVGYTISYDVGDGWREIEDKVYYYTEGSPAKDAILKIGEAFYAFGRYGILRTNTSFDVRDEEGIYRQYRAGATGELYISSWYEDGNGRWEYYQSDGTAAKGQMLSMGGERYIFTNYAKLVANCLYEFEGVTYFCDAEGHVSEDVKDGWTVFEDDRRFFVLEGSMMIDRVIGIGEFDYAFDEYGVMFDNSRVWIHGDWIGYMAMPGGPLCPYSVYEGRTGGAEYTLPGGGPPVGVLLIDGVLRILDDDGKLLKSTLYQNDGGIWRVDEKGVAYPVTGVGWNKTGDSWYYLDENYVPKTGWLQIEGIWYLMDKTGVMQTGWKKVAGKWYYMARNGAMQTGWVKEGGKLYYLNASGAMQTGWKKIAGKWYCLNSSGEALIGWKKVGGAWYYFKTNGEMASHEYVDGYWLNRDGSWTYKPKASWHKDETGWSYYDTAGYFVKNTTVIIDGKKYRFDTRGYLV